MDHHLFDAVNSEIERFDCLLIAAERWADSYKKDQKSHVALIKAEAGMAKVIRTYLRDMSELLISGNYVRWEKYYGLMQADFNVEVIINDDFYTRMDNEFFNVVFESVALATTIGAQAGEVIYQIPLGIQSTTDFIQKLSTEQVAWLVGKKVDKNGKVVDNPRPEYRISNKTRTDINQSIKTSIALGEDKKKAISRLMKSVNNPRRAATIAQTETVNAYGNGLIGFGKESGATGKEWENIGAEDVCAENSAQGPIPIDALFVSKDLCPAAHTGCRCNLRLLYANEYTPK